MADCDACGTDSDKMLYTCNECGKKLCSDCRLPENHLCGVRERVDEPRQWNRGTASTTTSAPDEENLRAECKIDDCTNTSDYDSRFCPTCLNRDKRGEWDAPLSDDTARSCEKATCSNSVTGSERYCFDCRREKANSSSGPAVKTIDGSPYNSAGSGGSASGTPAHMGDRSTSEKVRLGLKRARVRTTDAFWTIVGLVLLPFIIAKRALIGAFDFLTSKTGFTLFTVGLIALAAGPLGLVSLGPGVDDFTGDVEGWFDDAAAEAGDQEELNESRVQTLIHQEVNERRAENGVPRLDYSNELQRVARFHASNMYSQGFFAHESPDGSGPEARYTNFGIRCRSGENIAKTHAFVTVVTDDGSKYYQYALIPGSVAHANSAK